jgi:hypothetical protein
MQLDNPDARLKAAKQIIKQHPDALRTHFPTSHSTKEKTWLKNQETS